MRVLLLFLAAPALAQPMMFEGTICRINRTAERMIVGSDAGPRLRLTTASAAVTFEGIAYERADLRPGHRVRVAGNRNGSHIRATLIDARVRIADAALDPLVPSRTILGRFVSRDANVIVLDIAGTNFLRIESSNAFKPGDLLEVRGSDITVVTDREDPSCQDYARRGESKEDTTAREADEGMFLNP